MVMGENSINKGFKVGDYILVKGYVHSTLAQIKEIKGKRISALLSTTTTGALSVYSLRKDGYFVAVGWSSDECSAGGYFLNSCDNKEAIEREVIKEKLYQKKRALRIKKEDEAEAAKVESQNLKAEEITPEEIKTLIMEKGLTLDKLIDVVVDINGIVGVGLISLGDGLKKYTYSKAERHSQDYWNA